MIEKECMSHWIETFPLKYYQSVQQMKHFIVYYEIVELDFLGMIKDKKNLYE